MRLRITFSKNGALRYAGHLDLQTTWERTVRRAGLPLAYTHGFHPGPKIQIASALPLGFIGRAEIVDIWLEEVGADTPSLCGGRQDRPYVDILQSAAPPGLAVLSVDPVDEASPALQTQVASAEYEVTLLDPVDEAELAKNLAALLATGSLPRQRRGKMYDLRPLIEELSLIPLSHSPQFSQERGQLEGSQPGIFMRLAARSGATGRPEEVLDVLGIPPDTARIQRTRLILAGGAGLSGEE